MANNAMNAIIVTMTFFILGVIRLDLFCGFAFLGDDGCGRLGLSTAGESVAVCRGAEAGAAGSGKKGDVEKEDDEGVDLAEGGAEKGGAVGMGVAGRLLRSNRFLRKDKACIACG